MDWIIENLGKIVLVVFALLVIICPMIAGRTYSEGERVGVVTKLSRKGLIWKTWEGEMNVGGAHAGDSGTMVPTVWTFTVNNSLREAVDAVAKSGSRTVIRYRQVVMQWPWNGDTDYNVVSVDPANTP